MIKKLTEIKEYLTKVIAGKIPVNSQIIYNIQEIFNLLPNFDTESLIKAMSIQTNNNYLVLYLSWLTKTVIALHKLLNNKIAIKEEENMAKENAQKEEEKKRKEKEKEKEKQKDKDKDKEKDKEVKKDKKPIKISNPINSIYLIKKNEEKQVDEVRENFLQKALQNMGGYKLNLSMDEEEENKEKEKENRQDEENTENEENTNNDKDQNIINKNDVSSYNETKKSTLLVDTKKKTLKKTAQNFPNIYSNNFNRYPNKNKTNNKVKKKFRRHQYRRNK